MSDKSDKIVGRIVVNTTTGAVQFKELSSLDAMSGSASALDTAKRLIQSAQENIKDGRYIMAAWGLEEAAAALTKADEQTLKVGDIASLTPADCSTIIGKLVKFENGEPNYGHKYKLMDGRGSITYCTHGLTKINPRRQTK